MILYAYIYVYVFVCVNDQACDTSHPYEIGHISTFVYTLLIYGMPVYIVAGH